MQQPAPEEPVYVVVTERPKKVFVGFRGKVHAGQWHNGDAGSNNIGTVFYGNKSLLNAAMYSWDGQDSFTTTYAELLKRSGGWGVELTEDD